MPLWYILSSRSLLETNKTALLRKTVLKDTASHKVIVEVEH